MTGNDDPGSDHPKASTSGMYLSWLLALMVVGICAIALLGPLVTGAVQYHYSQTMLNQAVGLDGFAVAVVAPIALLAAALVRRGHPAGPLVALGPASFVVYMTPQYVIGPEYLAVAGNAERAFPLFVAVFVLASLALVQAWSLAPTPRCSADQGRRRAGALLGLAAFVVGGMYLASGFSGALADFSAFVQQRAASSEYDEHPTAFWLVAFLDLAVVVPVTIATAVGLLRARAWAASAYYGVLGWFALVPGSVAAMSLTMSARNDPAANGDRAALLTVVAAALLAAAAMAFRPLARRDAWSGAARPVEATAGQVNSAL